MIELLLGCDIPVQTTQTPWVELLSELFKIAFSIGVLFVLACWIIKRI